MDEIQPLTRERIDDVPILLAQLERMQVANLLDQHFLTHGNWQGLSLGIVSVVWLSHILSEGDHWLNHVEPWANQRLNCLQACLGQETRSLDFSDDRLAAVLDYLSSDEQWQTFERNLSQHLIRIYDLHPRRVRVDSTTVSGYVHPTPDGLFQFGHSKDHRPDLPQVKIKLSALDPLALPLGITIIPGQRADDGLYVPAIQQAQQTLGQVGLLYVGDCKMAALATRAYSGKCPGKWLLPTLGAYPSLARGDCQMIESLPEESLTDCFLAQSEVLMEGTALLQLPEGMRLDQIQIDFPWVDDNCRCYLPHIVLSTVF